MGLQWVIVLAPLLLHLLMLFWVWRSNITLEGALADKETINKEGERAKQLRATVVQQTFNRPLVNAPVQPGPDPEMVTLAQKNIDNEYALRHQVAAQALMQPLANTTTHATLNTGDQVTGTDGGDGVTPTPAAGEPAKPITSASRLIVFMSGYAGVSIGISLVSYAIYHAFAYPNKAIPSFDGLVTVLLSLGIGVLPYGFTKLAAATGSKTS
ncbi:hypothetical protein GCM10027348_38760 [Hymenobacter tenuis]